jgi:hypothetical protein
MERIPDDYATYNLTGATEEVLLSLGRAPTEILLPVKPFVAGSSTGKVI